MIRSQVARLVAVAILAAVAFRAEAVTLSFDSNAAGAQDATIADGSLQNNVFLTYTALEVSGNSGGGGMNSRSVLQFDVNALAGQYSSIDAITLRLTTSYNQAGAADTNIHQALASWVESQVSWNNRQTATPWASAGGEFSPSVLGSIDVSTLANSGAFDGVQEQVTVSLLPGAGNAAARKALIDSWTSGGNFGLLLKSATDTTAFVGYRDRSRGFEADRPLLTIEFSEIALVPEPSSILLMTAGTCLLVCRRRKHRQTL